MLPIVNVDPSRVLQIPAQSSDARKFNARALREQRLTQYFCGSQTANLGDYVLTLPQYRLSFDALQCFIGHARYYHFHVVLNGSLVGLSIDPSFHSTHEKLSGRAHHNDSQQSWEGVERGQVIRRASKTPYIMNKIPVVKNVGLGIVQAIDMNRHEVIILTPLPAEKMKGVNTLIVSTAPIPQALVVNV